jgi:group I intron endonuclease
VLAYLVTNQTNGKKYVGISSSQRRMKARWASHKNPNSRVSLLRNAIRKHGAENFTFEMIACAQSWADLCVLEQILIAQHGSFVGGRNGYNATKGGEGTVGYEPSAETVAKRAIALTGRTHTMEARVRMSAACRAQGRKGVPTGPRSAETRAKIRASHIGMRLSDETKKKISVAVRAKLPPAKEAKPPRLKGAKLSAAHRAAISAALIGRPLTSETKAKLSAVRRGRLGKPHSPETKAKLRAVKLGQPGKPHSPETRARMSAAQTGRVCKPETKAKLRAAAFRRSSSSSTFKEAGQCNLQF